MNNLRRVNINAEYIAFIRRLPCAVKGKLPIQPHHVAVTGMGGEVQNDLYAIPLSWEVHTGKGHISPARLEKLLGEPLKERIIFYLGLFIEYKTGRYDLDADESCQFIELRRRLKRI